MSVAKIQGLTALFTALKTKLEELFVKKTDTFVGSGQNAASGLVPKPSTTAGTTKYLREDGTWGTPTFNQSGGFSPSQKSASVTSKSVAASTSLISFTTLCTGDIEETDSLYLIVGNLDFSTDCEKKIKIEPVYPEQIWDQASGSYINNPTPQGANNIPSSLKPSFLIYNNKTFVVAAGCSATYRLVVKMASKQSDTVNGTIFFIKLGGI